MLNVIARDCAARAKPDLSVLVVNARTKLPGMVAGQPVTWDDEAGLHRWRNELKRVRSFAWPD